MAQRNGTDGTTSGRQAYPDRCHRQGGQGRPGGRHDIIDAVTPGLILRVSATRKTWLRRADGKRSLLGTYPSVSLVEARKACAEMHDMASAAVTVEGAAERFIQAHARHLRSGVQVEWLLRKHVILASGTGRLHRSAAPMLPPYCAPCKGRTV